jgi:hypothetical protein
LGWAQQTPAPVIPQETSSAQEPTPTPSEEFQGPVLLSRGGASSVRREAGEFRMRPYIGVNGVCDTNLSTISVDEHGQLPSAGACGAEARFGVAGLHTWKMTSLELDYRGTARHYTKDTFYDGIESNLTLGISHRASRRVTLDFGETVARYQRAYFLPVEFNGAFDPTTYNLSGNELFDSPTDVVVSMGRITYQRSVRTSFSASGVGFLVKRRSTALVGANGFIATGDVAYRVSRFQTIGVDYNFTRFDFVRQFGESNIHGIAFNYAARIGPRWEFALRVGGYRVESSRLAVVQIDPAIAAIIGVTTGTEIFHRVGYAPRAEARLSYTLRRSTWTLRYSRTIAPGNGVYLTSNYDSGQMGFTYRGSRRVSLLGSVAYNRYSSLAQTIGPYDGYGGGGGISVRVGKDVSLITRVDARHYNITAYGFQRNAVRGTVGLAWSPGEFPLGIW